MSDVIYQSKGALLAFLEENYEGPGTVLGYSAYDPGSDESYDTTGTSFAYVVDSRSERASITFVAPSSGKAEVTVSVWVEQVATINPAYYLKLALSEQSSSWSSYTGTEKYAFLGTEHSAVPGQGYATMRWVITGSAAGTPLTLYLGAAEVNASSNYTLRWGGLGEYPALVIKATALPESITTELPPA